VDVGTIAVVASVLVLAYQARELAKHTHIANEVAGVETNRELITMYQRIHQVFIDYPELRPQFFDEATKAPSEQDTIRLRELAEMTADAHQVGLETADRLASYEQYRAPWREYVSVSVAHSSTLRSVLRTLPSAWPSVIELADAHDRAVPPAPPTRPNPNPDGLLHPEPVGSA
jgi:hypothetical protein